MAKSNIVTRIGWLAVVGCAGLIGLFSFCSVPFYERAEINPGPTVSLGASFNSGWAGRSPEYPIGPITVGDVDYYVGGLGTLLFCYGLSRNSALFFQGSLGPGFWIEKKDYPVEKPRDSLWTWLYDFRAGTKVRLGRKDALRVGFGFPSLFDLNYLYDFNRTFSGNAGLGLRGISLGLTGRLPITRRIDLFLGGSITSGWEHFEREPYLPAFAVGIGVGANLGGGKN